MSRQQAFYRLVNKYYFRQTLLNALHRHNQELISRRNIHCSRIVQRIVKPTTFKPFLSGLMSIGGIYLIDNHSEARNSRFFKAVKHGNLSSVSQYLKSGIDPNAKHELGWSSIHVAAVNKQSDILKILLENGANPDATDDFVNIYQTAREHKMQSLDVMVAREEEFNSNLNLRANFRGCTALHYAALADDLTTVRILLEAGANPSKSNDYGRKAKDYARDPEMKKLLEKYSEIFDDIKKQEEVEERRKFPLEMRLKEHIVGRYLYFSNYLESRIVFMKIIFRSRKCNHNGCISDTKKRKWLD